MISFQKKEHGLIRRYPIVGGRRLSNFWWSTVIFLGGCGFLFTGISSFFNRNLLLITLPELHTTYKIEHVTHLKKKISISNYTNTFFIPELKQNTLPITPVAKREGTLIPVNITLIAKRRNFMGLATPGICIGDLALKIRDGIPILPFFPQGLVLSFYGFLGLWFSFHLWFTLLWKIGAGFNEVNGKEKSVRIFRWGRPGKNRRIDLKYSNELIETIKIELFPKPALFLCIKGDKKIPLTRLGEFIPLEELETQAAELTSLLQVPLEIEELST